jgi:hypothetical protein
MLAWGGSIVRTPKNRIFKIMFITMGYLTWLLRGNMKVIWEFSDQIRSIACTLSYFAPPSLWRKNQLKTKVSKEYFFHTNKINVLLQEFKLEGSK